LCGNSGRSPVPHLHLQVQQQGFPGSVTLPFCLKHYLESSGEGSGLVYQTSGVPAEGRRIQAPVPNPAMSEALASWLPGEYRYRITGEMGATWEETILLDFDESGRYRLRSRRTRARLTAFLSEGVFYTTEFEGTDDSLLAFFATGLARVPCIADTTATWADYAGSATFFPTVTHWLRGIIEPFFGPFLMRLTYSMELNPTGVIVCANLASDKDGEPQPPLNAPRQIVSQINGRRGVVKLEARLRNDRVLTAELLDYQPAC
jgi:hypothetical protein